MRIIIKKRIGRRKKLLELLAENLCWILKDLLNTLLHAMAENYEKIILCTNGLMLKQSYKLTMATWEKVKDILLLKISLDTLKTTTFKKITGVDALQTVLENIVFMKSKGFKIELNFVATKMNVKEIEDCV